MFLRCLNAKAKPGMVGTGTEPHNKTCARICCNQIAQKHGVLDVVDLDQCRSAGLTSHCCYRQFKDQGSYVEGVRQKTSATSTASLLNFM